MSRHRPADDRDRDRSPYADPLSYPGVPIDADGVLTEGTFHPVDGTRAGAAPRRQHRRPVLAVGSNACASQLRRKLAGAGACLRLPVTVVEAVHLGVGVSAHVAAAGYLPATPVPAPGERARFVVLWPDPDQLAFLDATEPNYRRRVLDADHHRLRSAATGEALALACEVYTSRRGELLDRFGAPRRLGPQPDLIESLLAESAELRDLAGASAKRFVATMAGSAETREAARRVFLAGGWVREAGTA